MERLIGKKRSLSNIIDSESKNKEVWTVTFIRISTPSPSNVEEEEEKKNIMLGLPPSTSFSYYCPPKPSNPPKIDTTLQWEGTLTQLKQLFRPESLIIAGIEQKGSGKRFKKNYYQYNTINSSSSSVTTTTTTVDQKKKKEEEENCITMTIPSELYSERELQGFINTINGHGKSVTKVLEPKEHINCILLANYFGMKISK